MFQRSIIKQDMVVNILDTSQIPGGSEADTVNIDTVIHLRTAEPTEITVVLPQVAGEPDIRLIDEVENRQEFTSPFDPEQLAVMPDAERVKYEALQEELRQKWDALKSESSTVKLSALKLNAGDQEM
jgi:hypothetical protein